MIPPPEVIPIGDVPRFRAALDAIYAALDDAIARRAPVCQLSGRCCRFAEYGHTLFLSAPEAARLRADAPPPSRPLDDGATCPWQDARGHCTARAARPLGCRVYYCDPTFDDEAAALSESALAALRRLADSHALPWGYAPLHHHLRCAGAGDPSTPEKAEDATMLELDENADAAVPGVFA